VTCVYFRLEDVPITSMVSRNANWLSVARMTKPGNIKYTESDGVQMWEKIVAIGTVILIILTSILVWQGFSRPAINWPILGIVGIVALALVIAAILNFKTAHLRAQSTSTHTEHSTIEQRQIWFYSPGICVSLNRGVGAVIVNLLILSTERTELSYMRIDLHDSMGKIAIMCQDSEQIIIEKLIPASKTIQQKISADEVEAFVKGAILSVNGYAKFRDGGKMTQMQFQINTIPLI
jgi:hypothetical protein